MSVCPLWCGVQWRGDPHVASIFKQEDLIKYGYGFFALVILRQLHCLLPQASSHALHSEQIAMSLHNYVAIAECSLLSGEMEM